MMDLNAYNNLSSDELYNIGIEGDEFADINIVCMVISANRNHIKAKEYFDNFDICTEKYSANMINFFGETSLNPENDYSITLLAHNYVFNIKNSYEKARELCELAIQKNNSLAMVILGMIYEKGYGIPQNYQKAHELYELAASHGNNTALINLGYMHEHGLGYPRNINKAIELYELAIDRGNMTAEENLEYLYENASYITNNLVETRVLYEIAIEKGCSSYVGELLYKLYKNHSVKALGVNEEYKINYIITHEHISVLKYLADEFTIKLYKQNLELKKELEKLKHENKELSDDCATLDITI